MSVALMMLLPVRWRSRRLMDWLALRESYMRKVTVFMVSLRCVGLP